jgi:hypothetical protein
MPTKTSNPAERLARSHRKRQQLIAAKAVRETTRLWRFGNWPSVSALALSTVRQALLEAARGAQAYVAAAARAWGVEPDPFGHVAEHTFADSASDGRPLGTLLDYPDFEVTAFVDQGMDHAQARSVGERHLERIVATQVADAARISTGVAVVNERTVKGYIRLLTPPSCSRCIILAGRFYKYSAGFARHPQCDCVHVPAAEAVDVPSPREVYDSLTDEERRKAGWSGHDQRAIDDGADLNQVTNVRRELKSVTVAGRPVKATGVRFRGQRVKVRLTPEQIYLEAERLGWDRDQTLGQLKRHGYIL